MRNAWFIGRKDLPSPDPPYQRSVLVRLQQIQGQVVRIALQQSHDSVREGAQVLSGQSQNQICADPLEAGLSRITERSKGGSRIVPPAGFQQYPVVE